MNEQEASEAAWENAKLFYPVRRAIDRGRLKREPCEVCGDPAAQGHHDDYSKPLDVRWLCAQHHREVHLVRAEPSREQLIRERDREAAVAVAAEVEWLKRVKQLEEALGYLADAENWLGNPEDQTATLHGHFTPYELARDALAGRS